MPGPSSPRRATLASPCTVWCWNSSFGVKRIPACRARLTTWMEMIESPPSSKKLSFRPTRSSFNTSCQIVAIRCSSVLCGAT
ncbi:hypothetical protein D3C84_402210 [compost metagenome]